MASHAVLHAVKSIGKIAAVCEARDHDGDVMNPDDVAEIAKMSADLFTIALRFANLFKFDLASMLVERVQDKNKVNLLDVVAVGSDDPEPNIFEPAKWMAWQARQEAKLVTAKPAEPVDWRTGKVMPIMFRHGKLDPIPWAFIAPYEARAKRNHSQTLDRLRERGGLSPCEAVAIVKDLDWEQVKAMSPAEADIELRRMVAEWEQKQRVT